MGSKFKSICRICLSTNVKLYSLVQDGLKMVYQHVTGINVSTVDNLPQSLCWECCHRLLKCHQFRKQALRTHTLLETLLDNEGSITKQNIRKIDRLKNGLASTLTQCVSTENYIDIIYEENISENENKKGSSIELYGPEIKAEFSDDHSEAKKESSDIENDINNYDSHCENSDDSHIEKEKEVVKKREQKKKPKKGKGVKSISKSLFTITDLSFEEQIQEIEKRKLTDNYTQSEFKCDKCFKGFLYESAFKFHMTRHTNKSGKFECEVCKVHFKVFSAKKHHMSSHWQKFKCKQCPFVTSRTHQARLHEAFHNGAQYNCSHCDEVFSKQTTYMSHLRVKHPSDIVCELCGNSFVSQKGLDLHKKLKHRFDENVTADEKQRCETCDLSFVNKNALQTHLRAKHKVGVEGVSPRRPRGSDAAVSRRNQLLSRRYVRRRPPQQPVQCEQCDATLPDARAYYAHFRRAHPDKNRTRYPAAPNRGAMCEVCGRMFKCRALLEDHSNTHAAGVQYKCPHCDKLFLTRYSLAVHSRNHSTHRAVFSCSVCQKNFTTRSNLQRHEFSHTGLKPHSCAACGKTFKYADEMRAHFQYVHLKKPYPKRVRPRRSKQDSSKTVSSESNERWPVDEKNE